MNMQEVKDLLNTFDASTLREFDLRKGDFEMYLSKNESYGRPTAATAVAPQILETPSTVVAEAANVAPTAVSTRAAEETAAPVDAVGEVVASPIVGNVYLQPAPDKPNFVQVGDVVSAEDTICIVEAMKMMNEVPAGISGTVTEIIVKNEQVVGIGDALVRIQPN